MPITDLVEKFKQLSITDKHQENFNKLCEDLTQQRRDYRVAWSNGYINRLFYVSILAVKAFKRYLEIVPLASLNFNKTVKIAHGPDHFEYQEDEISLIALIALVYPHFFVIKKDHFLNCTGNYEFLGEKITLWEIAIHLYYQGCSAFFVNLVFKANLVQVDFNLKRGKLSLLSLLIDVAGKHKKNLLEEILKKVNVAQLDFNALSGDACGSTIFLKIAQLAVLTNPTLTSVGNLNYPDLLFTLLNQIPFDRINFTAQLANGSGVRDILSSHPGILASFDFLLALNKAKYICNLYQPNESSDKNLTLENDLNSVMSNIFELAKTAQSYGFIEDPFYLLGLFYMDIFCFDFAFQAFMQVREDKSSYDDANARCAELLHNGVINAQGEVLSTVKSETPIDKEERLLVAASFSFNVSNHYPFGNELRRMIGVNYLFGKSFPCWFPMGLFGKEGMTREDYLEHLKQTKLRWRNNKRKVDKLLLAKPIGGRRGRAILPYFRCAAIKGNKKACFSHEVSPLHSNNASPLRLRPGKQDRFLLNCSA